MNFLITFLSTEKSRLIQKNTVTTMIEHNKIFIPDYTLSYYIVHVSKIETSGRNVKDES